MRRKVIGSSSGRRSKYLARYLAEANPSLMDVAQVAAVLAEREMLMREH